MQVYFDMTCIYHQPNEAPPRSKLRGLPYKPVFARKKTRKKTAESSDKSADNAVSVKYDDSDYWPVHPPTGLWLNSISLDSYLREWKVRKDELRAKEITREEYFEWKLNWPYTCDGQIGHEGYIGWRGMKY